MQIPLSLYCDTENEYLHVWKTSEQRKDPVPDPWSLIVDPMQNSRCLLNQTWENVTMGDNDTGSAGVDNMNKLDFPQDDIHSRDGCDDIELKKTLSRMCSMITQMMKVTHELQFSLDLRVSKDSLIFWKLP